MKDPIIAQFAEACGAVAPLDLRVDLVDVGRRTRGTIPMPFALVGRDDACDVTLTDSEVNPRHAWLQVVGGRVFAVDLGSRAGLEWPGGGTSSGWLDVGSRVRIGPFVLRLCSPVSPRPVHSEPGTCPTQSDPDSTRPCPTSTLEFRNGKRAKDRWTVNRLVTLIGRAPDCKIRLSADDIAGYHCGLVLTPSGLWVVDLSARGVVVNGERLRVSPLRPGAELWVGRFLIGLHNASTTGSVVAARPVTTPTQPTPPPSQSARQQPPPAAPAVARTEPAEDEVPLGVAPPPDPLAGLPSSHIMADAFRLWTTAAGSISNPILVSGSGPISHSDSQSAQASLLELLGASNRPATHNAPAASGMPSPLPGGTEAIIVSLLHELGELHGQMLTQFQQSLVLMVQLFAYLRRDQLPAMQRELARIQELNSELAQLQAELARRAAGEPTRTPPPVTPAPAPAPVASASAPTPPPAQDSTALHNWVMDRINTLQRERQARWQSLVGMFSARAQ